MKNKDSEKTRCQMMIRKPIDEVFNAFIDPSETTNFWFTKSSGTLEEGKSVIWEWEMYGVNTQVAVKNIIKNKMISIEWDEPPITVDFYFEKLSQDQTYVIIEEYGYQKSGDKLIAKIKDSTGGFTSVLDGLKAYLEHGINLNLILDKYPKKQK